MNLDQRAKGEILETLKLFGVSAKDRQECLQDLAEAFDDYRRRMRRFETERREIESNLRKPNASVSISGDEPEYAPRTCWVVEIETDCWLAPWQGDPGRTLLLENAKRYKSEHAANCALRRARTFRPLKYAKIYQPNAENQALMREQQ